MRAGDVLDGTNVVVSGHDEDTGERLIPVSCWCEWRYVLVTVDDVFAGKTATCGKKKGGCEPPSE